jgi:cytoskeletal protein RodZ
LKKGVFRVNNSFKLITTVLIVILIALLVWVALWYFKQPSNPMPINTDYLTTDIINSNNNNNTEEVIMSGSKEPDNSEEKATDKVIPVDTITDEESLLIISDSKTSDKEKQEILDSIDSTLMELLEVVDKVQTVDETRLIVDESEVQK